MLKKIDFEESCKVREDISEPDGDPHAGYPQVCIRTNRTPSKTNLEKLIAGANSVVESYDKGDVFGRAIAVMEYFENSFASGEYGHVWIEVYRSASAKDCINYSYIAGIAFVKKDLEGLPERQFNLQKALPIANYYQFITNLEEYIIPEVNKESLSLTIDMVHSYVDPSFSKKLIGEIVIAYLRSKNLNALNGVYTPLTTCAWFCCKIWNKAMKQTFNFEQEFNGAVYAEKWGMPFLKEVNKIADAGVVAENIYQSLSL